MPTCRKCGGHFPNKIRIGGELKSLSQRYYCLSCSPYRKHNTRVLERETRGCSVCGSVSNKRKSRGSSTCYSCINKKTEKGRADVIYSLVGESCWLCGWTKGAIGRPVLDFHHLHDKKFCLNKRNVGHIAWKTVLAEMQKCVLLCCRCHREHHVGLISKATIEDLHLRSWENLLESLKLARATLSGMDSIKEKNRKVVNKCEFCEKKFVSAKLKKKRRFCSVECARCGHMKVANRPSSDKLAEMVKEMSMVQIGKTFGVSDNAVRKWARRYGLAV